MRTLPLIPALGILASVAGAQNQRFAFSTTWHGPTISVPDPLTGVPITEGDILFPSTGPHPFPGAPRLGPVFTPTVVIPHGAGGLGLAPGCVGHPGGTPCWVEVDALSFGSDVPVGPAGFAPGAVWYSVDKFATGFGSGPLPPNLTTEAGGTEAPAGTFTYPFPLPPGPLPPFAVNPGSYGVLDGDGFGFFSGFAMPGNGLIEPDLPIPGPISTGDDLDGFDVAEIGFGPLLLYSIDGPLLDPLRGAPNAGSSLVHGVAAGDILSVGATGTPIVWAPAVALGLDRAAGSNSDDLDALSVWDNGDGVFQPSATPLDWTGGATDMVLFSVRRGSAVIGLPDSIFGIPIEAGDVLTTPLLMGGVSPFPGIFIAAENLGLATRRSMGAPFGDELNGLDFVARPLFDCNFNGVEDAMDIFLGTASDANANGIPDSCEVGVGTQYGFCTLPLSPCGNPFQTAGCLNASGTGALLNGSGSPSLGADNLVLTTGGMNPFGFALTFMGNAPVPGAPIQNGILTAAGTNYRFPPYATGTGTGSLGPGIVGLSIALHPPAGHITVGSTWYFQTWYRDVGGPCGSASNFSNGLAVTFKP